MARRPEAAVPRDLKLSPDELEAGISRLEKRLVQLRAFEPTSIQEQYNHPELDALKASIDDTLVRTFGSDTHDYLRYRGAAQFDSGPMNLYSDTYIGEVHAAASKSKAQNIALLEQAIESLKERLEESSKLNFPGIQVSPVEHNERVFIVHGHDDGPREAVARFLDKLGLKPIILNEQANQGRTIIEKIEAYGNVGFAVVLLTPDDEGGLRGGPQQARPRQNVLIELGYFIGKLSRKRVCTLKVGDMEIPSDWRGVVDEPFDGNGAWKQTLARELQAAGYKVDWNIIMTADAR
jgi:predicted nucleotide-binding protein